MLMKTEVFWDNKVRLWHKNPLTTAWNQHNSLFLMYESALVTYSSRKDTVLNEWSVLSFKYNRQLMPKLNLQMYFDKEKLL
jgi:hypothetical protein